LVLQLRSSASKVKQHPPAAKKAQEAQAAAKGPANEKLAGAKAKQVDKMQDAKGKEPQPSGFLALLRAEIEKVMPKNLDQADKFMKGGEKEQLKSAAGGNVSQQKQEAAGPVQQASSASPNASGVPEKQATPAPEEPAPAPAPVDTNDAVPAPKPEAQVSQTDTKKDADQQLKEAEVTPDQLKKANDPRFSAVLTAKSNAEKVADASSGKYRAGEKTALVQGIAKAAGDAKKGLAAIHSVKKSSGAAVKTRQQLAKEKDEAERKKVTDTIEGIYSETKANVEKKLSTLETDVMARFDRGIDAALSSMQSYANAEIERFKEERYSGVVGAGRWIADLFRPVPEGIKQILATARTRFTAQMDALAVEVSRVVDTRLKEAKDEVAKGQKRIDTYVKGLPKNLQAVGKEAQGKVAERFKELEQGIDEKANDLAQKLAQKYKEASDKADAALKKIEEENEGALKGLADKLGEVVKALMEFKARLMAVIKKGEEAIKKILADPIAFLGNLINAIKKGFQQFVGNIWKHLKAGFMKWLFGALAEAGIQIPPDLNVWSVLKLVLDVLGLTYAWIRSEAVKLIGERNMALIEKLVDYISITIKGGPQALWEKLKEDLSNLKAMVIDAIQGWLIDTVVKSAVTKILSMFNPAGAIVQAIMMIYNVVTWVIENASRILSLVEAVVNSVSAIADGNIGGAATWIENALAGAVPMVIGLLAGLVGLGGISGKIREFITKTQAKVRAAVLGWLKKAWAWVKKLFGKLTGKGKKDEDPAAQKRLDAAAKAAQERLKKPLAASQARAIIAAIGRENQVRAELQTAGGTFRVFLKVNPEKTVPLHSPGGDPKEDLSKAVASAGEAVADVTKMREIGKKANDAGQQRNRDLRSSLEQRQKAGEGKVIPTGSTEGAGGDAAFLIPASAGNQATVELIEGKKGSFRTLRQVKGGRPVPEGSHAIPVASSTEAVARLANDPATRQEVIGAGKGKGGVFTKAKEDGDIRILRNELSSFTSHLTETINKMYTAVSAAIASKALTPDDESALRGVLEGKGGLLKLVLDVDKIPNRLSDVNRQAVVRLLDDSINALLFKVKEPKTKIEVVFRKRFDPKSDKKITSE
jgi:hypothetical protein